MSTCFSYSEGKEDLSVPWAHLKGEQHTWGPRSGQVRRRSGELSAAPPLLQALTPSSSLLRLNKFGGCASSARLICCPQVTSLSPVSLRSAQNYKISPSALWKHP